MLGALGVAGSVGLGLAVGRFVVVRVARNWATLDAWPRVCAVVLATGALFGAVVARLGPDPALPAYLVLVAGLVAVVIIDLEHHLIPNRLVYPVLALGVVLLALASAIDGTPSYLWRALVGGVLSFTGLGLLHLAQPQAIGFGDVRIGVIAGMFLGWLSLQLVLVGFALAFGTAALVAIILLVTGRRALRDRIAFAPFLVVGQFLAILVGSYGRHP